MPAAKSLVTETQLNSQQNDGILCFLLNRSLILIYGGEGDLT